MNSAGPPVTYVLSDYETYYQKVGLTQYGVVFRRNKEKQFEASMCARYLKEWFDAVARDRPLRVLYIGCGLGEFTCLLLDRLYAAIPRCSQKHTINCDLVDINSTAFDHFRTSASKVSNCNIIVNRCFYQPWQTIPSDQVSEAYDLVIANHSLYGCANDECVARSLCEAIAPGGRALVALVSNKAALTRMRAEASILNHGAEEFEMSLNRASYAYTRLVYESKFRFDPSDPQYVDWLFASGDVCVVEQARLLQQYASVDLESQYISNRAMIYIVEPKRVEISAS